MKKILIANNNLHIGGVQKALISLLWNIHADYDVTLLLLYKGGELLHDLPADIKVISASGAWRFLGMTKDDAHTLTDRVGRGFFAAISRVLGRKYAIGLMSLGQRNLHGYDVGISYLHNSSDKAFYGGCNDFVLRHVKTPEKITFLHCDYVRCGADTPENGRQYSQFNTIAACSQGCADAFLKAHPQMKEKVMVIRNCHQFEQIKGEAEKDPKMLEQGKINVVTVARLGKEKGVVRAVKAVAELGMMQERLHYYVIGDGVQRPLVEQLIAENNLQNVVTLCGQLTNPYGYIQAADLLWIPSYSEAAPLVIGEAASLGTPILSTETSSAREMIENNGIGWVCENSEDAMRESLKWLISNSEQIEMKKECLKRKQWSDESARTAFKMCIETQRKT